MGSLSKEKKWLMSQGAFLSEQNNYSHDDIYLDNDGEIIDREAIKKAIESGWSIRDRESLLKTFDWLLEDGHSVVYNDIRSFPNTLSETGKKAFLEGYDKNHSGYYNIEMINEFDNEILVGGTSAWDYGRYGFLCRYGVLQEYISEDEMWEKLYMLSKRVRYAYSNPKEYCIGYFVGRGLWLGKEDINDSIDYHEDISKRLLFKKTGPWYKLDWNIDLEGII